MSYIISTIVVAIFSLMFTNALKGQMKGIPLITASVVASLVVSLFIALQVLSSFSTIVMSSGRSVRSDFSADALETVVIGAFITLIGRIIYFSMDKNKNKNKDTDKDKSPNG